MAHEEKNIAAHAKASKTAMKRPEGKLPFFKRVIKWFREMKSELKKVLWPTPKQTANNTVVALAVMAAAAVVLWGFDSFASATVRTIIELVS